MKRSTHAAHLAALGHPSVSMAHHIAKNAPAAALTAVGITCATDSNGFVDFQATAG